MVLHVQWGGWTPPPRMVQHVLGEAGSPPPKVMQWAQMPPPRGSDVRLLLRGRLIESSYIDLIDTTSTTIDNDIVSIVTSHLISLSTENCQANSHLSSDSSVYFDTVTDFSSQHVSAVTSAQIVYMYPVSRNTTSE